MKSVKEILKNVFLDIFHFAEVFVSVRLEFVKWKILRLRAKWRENHRGIEIGYGE